MEDIFKNFKPEGEDYQKENQEKTLKTIEATKKLIVENLEKWGKFYRATSKFTHKMAVTKLENDFKKLNLPEESEEGKSLRISISNLDKIFLEFNEKIDQSNEKYKSSEMMEDLWIEENLENISYESKNEELERYVSYLDNIEAEVDEIKATLNYEYKEFERKLKDIIGE